MFLTQFLSNALKMNQKKLIYVVQIRLLFLSEFGWLIKNH